MAHFFTQKWEKTLLFSSWKMVYDPHLTPICFQFFDPLPTDEILWPRSKIWVHAHLWSGGRWLGIEMARTTLEWLCCCLIIFELFLWSRTGSPAKPGISPRCYLKCNPGGGAFVMVQVGHTFPPGQRRGDQLVNNKILMWKLGIFFKTFYLS